MYFTVPNQKERAKTRLKVVEKYAQAEWNKEARRLLDTQLPSRPVKEGTSWVRCKDGITRRVDKMGNLDLGDVKPIL